MEHTSQKPGRRHLCRAPQTTPEAATELPQPLLFSTQTAVTTRATTFRALLDSSADPPRRSRRARCLDAWSPRTLAANIDAAVHVAHAFTVHAEESESDYFSVVDDLQSNDEDPGAAHIGDMELTAGLFYGYVVVDVPALISNLTGSPAEDWRNADRELAATVVKHLIHLIATVSPGAKLGSTAPYAYADLMLIEAGSRQPRSLANAFRGPVPARTNKAVEALEGQLGKLDSAYGSRETRRVMSLDACNIPDAERLDLDRLASWAADAVSSGEAS